MKRTLLATSFLLYAGMAPAQMMTTYGISPNWTATDIQGNSHTLYDYLDQGYTVVLDFSTTWCPPCVAFHQSHTLNDLFNTYGPGSSYDKVMTFLIECDNATDLDDLYGTGGQSVIDWVTGTDYPIIDDASIADAYGVVGYPTIYTICPSRMISSFSYQPSVGFMWGQCQTCDHHVVDSPHDATLLGGQQAVTCKDPASPLHTTLYNIGTAPLTTATIEAVEVYTGEVVSTISWTGSLPTYGQAGVDLPAWAAPPGQQGYYFRLTTPDDDPANDSILPEYYFMRSPSSPGLEVTVEVLTDDAPGEISWRLEDYGFSVVDRRDAGAYTEANTLYAHTYTLQPDRCYRFICIDSGGDGITAPGYFRLSNGGTPFITAAECHTEVHPNLRVDQAYFTVETSTGVIPSEEAPVLLLPNPASDRVRLTGVPPGAVLSLYDPAGRLMRRQQGQGATWDWEVSDLPNGLYVVAVAGPRTTTTHRLVIAR